MQRRLLQATITTVLVAIVLIGVPTATLSALMVRNGIESNLTIRTLAVARQVEKSVAVGEIVPEGLIEPWVQNNPSSLPINIWVDDPRASEPLVVGPEMPDRVISMEAPTPSGAVVVVSMSGYAVAWRMAEVVIFVGLASLIAAVAAVGLARYYSRKLSAPLIYLAASAEQLGSGQLRPRMEDSGIEEIDLVAEELLPHLGPPRRPARGRAPVLRRCLPPIAYPAHSAVDALGGDPTDEWGSRGRGGGADRSRTGGAAGRGGGRPAVRIA